VLILTNNIQYFSSDTTRLYIHKNVITFLCIYKRVVSDEKYYILSVTNTYTCRNYNTKL
jgi:hypothetical protein